MLRIRHTNKKLTELPKDAVYVELTNKDGEIICVIGEDKLDNSMFIFDSKDEKAKRYEKYFGVKFVDNIKVMNVDPKFL